MTGLPMFAQQKKQETFTNPEAEHVMAQLELSSGNLVEIADQLFDFVRDEVVPGTGFTAEAVFQHLGELVEEFEPRNRALLDRRAEVQQQIDDYYREKRAGGWQPGQDTASRTPQTWSVSSSASVTSSPTLPLILR